MAQGIPRTPAPHEWRLTKKCSRCCEVKPWARYAPKAYWPDGTVRQVQSYCHACSKDRLEYKAEYRERNRERINAYSSAWWKRRRREKAGGSLLDAAPFVRFVNARLAEGWTQGQLSEHAGITDRTMRRLVNGEQQQVRLHAVDRLAVATGYHLNDMYPPELEEAA